MNGNIKLNVENEGNITKLIPQPLTRSTKILVMHLCTDEFHCFPPFPPKCIPLSVPDVQNLSAMQAVTIRPFRSPSGAPPSYLHDFSSRHPAAVKKSLEKHIYIKRIRDQLWSYVSMSGHFITLLYLKPSKTWKTVIKQTTWQYRKT